MAGSPTRPYSPLIRPTSAFLRPRAADFSPFRQLPSSGRDFADVPTGKQQTNILQARFGGRCECTGDPAEADAEYAKLVRIDFFPCCKPGGCPADIEDRLRHAFHGFARVRADHALLAGRIAPRTVVRHLHEQGSDPMLSQCVAEDSRKSKVAAEDMQDDDRRGFGIAVFPDTFRLIVFAMNHVVPR